MPWLYSTFWLQTMSKAQNGGARIRDTFGSIFIQWEEVETRRPSLHTVYGITEDSTRILNSVV